MKKCRPIPLIAFVVIIFASCTKPAHTCTCTIGDRGSVTTTKIEYKKSKNKVEQKCDDEKKFHEEQYPDQPWIIVECKVD
jgi:hypothetical protein